MLKRIVVFSLLLGSTPIANAQVSFPLSDSMQSILDEFVMNDSIPGGILAVHHRSENWTWKGQSGIANVSTQHPADTSFQYRIGSVSKNFMAATILDLVDKNIVSLNDSIGIWLDQVLLDAIPYSEQITIKRLLNHTSGIYSYTDDTNFLTALLTDPNASFTPDSLINIALSHPPDFIPGANWKYNNTGYVLLTKIVEASTGIPYHQYAQDSILIPLGMNNTFYPDTNIIFGDHMRCYANYDNDSILEDYTEVTATWAIGAGEIVSNLDDQITYFNALIDGTIISPAGYNEMITPFFPSSYTYGLGTYIIDNNLVGHPGLYFSTTGLWYFQDIDVVVAYQFNLFDVDAYNEVLVKIYDLLSTSFNTTPEWNQNEELIVYPNPVYDQLNVSIAEGGVLNLYDYAGNLLESYRITDNEVVDMSRYVKGTYFIELRSDEGVVTKRKVVKL